MPEAFSICEPGPAPEVYDCTVCGCCETPERCVWSFTCPECLAEPGEQCYEGNRLVKLHEARWALVAA